MRRLCGWNSTQKLRPVAADSASMVGQQENQPVKLRVQITPAGGSLLDFCTQELFSHRRTCSPDYYRPRRPAGRRRNGTAQIMLRWACAQYAPSRGEGNTAATPGNPDLTAHPLNDDHDASPIRLRYRLDFDTVGTLGGLEELTGLQTSLVSSLRCHPLPGGRSSRVEGSRISLSLRQQSERLLGTQASRSKPQRHHNLSRSLAGRGLADPALPK